MDLNFIKHDFAPHVLHIEINSLNPPDHLGILYREPTTNFTSGGGRGGQTTKLRFNEDQICKTTKITMKQPGHRAFCVVFFC